MKKILLIVATAILLVATACSNPYVKVMDLKDGKYISVKTYEQYTIGDTLVIQRNDVNRHHTIYGKYIGIVPKNDKNRSYHKAIVIK